MQPGTVARVLLRRGLKAIRALVAAGKLPEEALAALPFAAQYQAEADAHLGDEVSFVEMRAVSVAQVAAAVGSLCFTVALREGVFVKDKLGVSTLHPLIESALACGDREGKALDRLPRARRLKAVLGVRERAALLQANTATTTGAE